MSEGSTSSAERRTARHRACGVVEMCGVILFFQEGKRIGFDRLLFEGSCCLLGRRRKFRVVRNVYDSEQSIVLRGSECSRRDVQVLTALTACSSDEKPVDFVVS